MTYSPQLTQLWSGVPHSIDTMTSYGTCFVSGLGAAAATAYPTANMAIYVPFRLRHTVTAKKTWVACQTTGTGNIQIGLYDQTGARLITSGNVAKVAAADELVVDTTDTVLAAGLYYMALVDATTTATYHVFVPAAPNAAAYGVRTEAVGSISLPATATWTVNQTLAYIPIMGLFTETIAT